MKNFIGYDPCKFSPANLSPFRFEMQHLKYALLYIEWALATSGMIKLDLVIMGSYQLTLTMF